MSENQHIDLKDRTKQFVLQVALFVKFFDSNLVEKEIAKQLVRNSLTVGINTRTAFKGHVKTNFVDQLNTVVTAAEQCSYLLEVLNEYKASENFDNYACESLLQEARELQSIFISIVKRNNTD